jgi:IS1 family transposase
MKKDSIFHTDDWAPFKGVIPEEIHHFTQYKKYTNHIERFNNTVRQHVSRLVRLALSFSKDLENHIGALKYFFYLYNKE